MITIFSAARCPFAQRTMALLSQLDEPFELREVDLDARDPELLELSPTGRVPFLVDGDVRLFESAVINDYLAEKLGYERAYSDDLTLRAQQNLLIRRWDDVIAPELYRSLGSPLDDAKKATLRLELAFLSTIADRMGGDVNNLAALHVATHWARMDWLRELTELPALIDEHPPLRKWLDLAAALPAIQATLPSREATIERYRSRYAAQVAE